jgi:hypothetical protein
MVFEALTNRQLRKVISEIKDKNQVSPTIALLIVLSTNH